MSTKSNRPPRSREELLKLFEEDRKAAANSRDRDVDTEWGQMLMEFPEGMTQEEINAEVEEMEAWRERKGKETANDIIR